LISPNFSKVKETNVHVQGIDNMAIHSITTMIIYYYYSKTQLEKGYALHIFPREKNQCSCPRH